MKKITAFALATTLMVSSAGLPALAQQASVETAVPVIGDITDATSITIEPLAVGTVTPHEEILATQEANLAEIQEAIANDAEASAALEAAGYTLEDVIGFVSTDETAVTIFVRAEAM